MKISNYEDIIDSRDVIERIGELENALCDYEEEIEEWESKEVEERGDKPENPLDDDEKNELDILIDLQDQCNYGDWEYGEALIHEDYFVEYVEDMLKDIGDLPHDIPWYIEIDWEKTAENIKMDYAEVDFGGETYYIRS